MHLISCYPMPDNLVQDVLDGKYPNVFLNPSAECTDTFYGFYGTQEQYDLVYSEQVNSQITAKLVEKYGMNIPAGAEQEMKSNYKDWWAK